MVDLRAESYRKMREDRAARAGGTGGGGSGGAGGGGGAPQNVTTAQLIAKWEEVGTANIKSTQEYKQAVKEAEEINRQYLGSRSSPQKGDVTTATAPPAITGQAIAPPAEQKGWSNVWEVYKASLNPFSQTSIVATTDNRVFNTAAELIANNPYTTMLTLMGVSGVAALIKGVGATAGKFAVGKTVQTTLTGAPGFVVNTKVAAQSVGLIAKIAVQMKKPAFVVASIGAMIGTYPWSEWALGEAKEGMIMNVGRAVNTGDPQVMADFQRTSDEIFDIKLWENIARLIPFANIAFSFSQKSKSLMAQKAVNDKIIQNKVTQAETGVTPVGTTDWDKVREERKQEKQEEADMDKAAIDYYNEERKKMLVWERELREKAKKEERKDNRKAYEKQADFWAIQAQKQRELEAADRKAIADFWAQYRITMQKISDNNRPSNLNFGLL